MTALRQALAEQSPLRTARIPLGKIRVHPRNLRLDLGDLTDLAESLKADGQHQLVEVHRKGEFFELLDGHRRFGASVIAGRRTLDCVVVPRRSDADAIRGMLATAVHARPLSPEERARGIEALIGEGVTVTQIAADLGVTPDTVRRWRAWEQVETAPRRPVVVHRPHRTPTTVSVRRVGELADRWTSRAADGLTADQAAELLAELRALANGQVSRG